MSKLSYEKAKLACSSLTVNVTGFTTRPQMNDFEQNAIPKSGADGIFWQPNTDSSSEGKFYPDPNVPNDRGASNPIPISRFATSIEEPNNGAILVNVHLIPLKVSNQLFIWNLHRSSNFKKPIYLL